MVFFIRSPTYQCGALSINIHRQSRDSVYFFFHFAPVAKQLIQKKRAVQLDSSFLINLVKRNLSAQASFTYNLI